MIITTQIQDHRIISGRKYLWTFPFTWASCAQSYINTNKNLHKLLRNELWTSSRQIWLGNEEQCQEKSLCFTHWGYKVHFQGPLFSSHPIPTIQTKLSEFQVLPHGAWCDAKGCIHHNYYVRVPKHYLNLNTPWDLTTGLQKYREEGPCRQTGVASLEMTDTLFWGMTSSVMEQARDCLHLW